MNLIDAHTHTYLRGIEDLKSMAESGVTHAVICAFFPVFPSSSSTLLDLFRWMDITERGRFLQAGMTPILAVGIHPRSLPPAKEADVVFQAVRNMVREKSVQAIGEIGLEKGTAEECSILLRQLLLAKDLGIPAVIHTPRSDKAARVRQTMEIAAESGIPANLLIFDHMTPELIGEVRKFNSGIRVGLTIQPGKTTPEDVLKAAEDHGVWRMHLDSDLSNAPSSPAAVATCARSLLAAGMKADDVRAIAFGNAAEAFGISDPPSAHRNAAP